MKKEENGLRSEVEKIQKEIAENIKNNNFKQEFKAKEKLDADEKTDWQQVEWLFKKAAKLAEIRKFNLFNEIVDLMAQFYDAEREKFVAMPLTQQQKCALTKFIKQYIKISQTEGNVFVDSHGVINCRHADVSVREM